MFFSPLKKPTKKKSERKNHPLGFRTSSVLKTSERSFLAKILWWEGFWERYPPLGKGSPCIKWRMFWKSNTEYHFGANTKRIMISMCDDSASKIEQTLWIWFHHHENNRCKFQWSLKIRIPFLSRFSSFFSFQAMNFGTFLGCHAARLQVPCLLKYRILLLFHPLSHLDITPKSQQHSPLSLEKSQQFKRHDWFTQKSLRKFPSIPVVISLTLTKIYETPINDLLFFEGSTQQRHLEALPGVPGNLWRQVGGVGGEIRTQLQKYLKKHLKGPAKMMIYAL